MSLDEMQQWWSVEGARFERGVSINERLLREMLLRKVRFAFVPMQIRIALEVTLGAALVIASATLVSKNVADPKYLLIAGGVALLAAYVTALCAFALHQSTAVDYAAPVAALQRTLEKIRLAEYRAFKWSLLLGIVAWLPIALIVFEACTGIPALAKVNMTWLIANLLFGAICLVIGQTISHRYVERRDLAPWAQRLVASLSGRGIRKATQHLHELARFESGEPRRPGV